MEFIAITRGYMMVQAAKHCTQDVGIWQWASRPSPGTPPIFLPCIIE